MANRTPEATAGLKEAAGSYNPGETKVAWHGGGSEPDLSFISPLPDGVVAAVWPVLDEWWAAWIMRPDGTRDRSRHASEAEARAWCEARLSRE